ncbi:hypothetical protein L226DRAFT_526749 [Lentinus tigrinus ALCF2SS1-7]|uniref:uncharacterized protein n=1 Tax=Lentinus tigrinus ALCF2SS1-7 TaxID=1328758 RepID=UPI001165E760|nr:hypothetical protein L226DRAFT_526749 [Lentinus tigrinus ALCF2SS1-7]
MAGSQASPSAPPLPQATSNDSVLPTGSASSDVSQSTAGSSDASEASALTAVTFQSEASSVTAPALSTHPPIPSAPSASQSTGTQARSEYAQPLSRAWKAEHSLSSWAMKQREELARTDAVHGHLAVYATSHRPTNDNVKFHVYMKANEACYESIEGLMLYPSFRIRDLSTVVSCFPPSTTSCQVHQGGKWENVSFTAGLSVDYKRPHDVYIRANGLQDNDCLGLPDHISNPAIPRITAAPRVPTLNFSLLHHVWHLVWSSYQIGPPADKNLKLLRSRLGYGCNKPTRNQIAALLRQGGDDIREEFFAMGFESRGLWKHYKQQIKLLPETRKGGDMWIPESLKSDMRLQTVVGDFKAFASRFFPQSTTAIVSSFPIAPSTPPPSESEAPHEPHNSSHPPNSEQVSPLADFMHSRGTSFVDTLLNELAPPSVGVLPCFEVLQSTPLDTINSSDSGSDQYAAGYHGFGTESLPSSNSAIQSSQWEAHDDSDTVSSPLISSVQLIVQTLIVYMKQNCLTTLS